ncbi:hypothetical protein [Agrococcus sp. Marseille-Q4369]|uniref:hypothetical protein n=1 Tax=Agrococcus sp. Marseille-Q4369 TaxID=2810513 RepID=UPI001B8AA2DD|nr:hypothetical protein [Agrococcus sp. Marseille-Q4369]QUW18241.1 hypothetical protein JSQ78_10440 [Agrococcus sp. Marseille-Q4369]
MTLSDWSEHPAARAELLAAADRLPIDAASMLIDAAEGAVEDVLARPDAWPALATAGTNATIRRRSIRPFRMSVVYVVAHQRVRVLAYAHERRRPGYWASRVQDFT